MRLLNAETLQVELLTSSLPTNTPYAILSHTWNDDEVTLEEMKDLPLAIAKTGFPKIEAAARLTIGHGLRYIWVDTCCIDKTSSAELSEAINSMFRWYADASVCFAFLSDWKGTVQVGDRTNFQDCKW
jgi:hypothetical protein